MEKIQVPVKTKNCPIFIGGMFLLLLLAGIVTGVVIMAKSTPSDPSDQVENTTNNPVILEQPYRVGKVYVTD